MMANSRWPSAWPQARLRILPVDSLAGSREVESVIADKGNDSAEKVAKIESFGAVAVIPQTALGTC